jgi:hypothetical protein
VLTAPRGFDWAQDPSRSLAGNYFLDGLAC